jgi:hypothetical protein
VPNDLQLSDSSLTSTLPASRAMSSMLLLNNNVRPFCYYKSTVTILKVDHIHKKVHKNNSIISAYSTGNRYSNGSEALLCLIKNND